MVGKRTLVALLLLASAVAAQPDTKAQWIWYPEDPASTGAGQSRWFRHTVTLAAAPTTSTLRWLSDDDGECFVNGKPAPKPLETGRFSQLLDLAPLLGIGENVLAFRVHNAGGPGGLLLSASLTTADGKTQRVFSDASWRVSRDGPEGWARIGFDDRAWVAARPLGGAFLAPWYGHPAFDLAAYLEPDEAASYRAWSDARTALPPTLAAEPPLTAKLAQEPGGCTLRLNGQARPPFLYRGTVDPLSDLGRRQIAIFGDAGVHLYSAYFHLASCRPAPGVYDFSRLDQTVRAYLSVDPQAYVHLVLHLVPPTWWMDAHPDELVRYAAGDDYNSGDEALRVRAPSLASQVWYDDAADLWRRCLEHLQAQPWGKRLLGYQPGMGIYTEWHYYGSWSEQMPDTGAAMTRHFRDWLGRKYPSDAALQQAWRNPAVTLATATVPLAAPRVDAAGLGLRDPARQAWALDYYRCQQEITAERLEGLCRLTKELSAGRSLAGAFYGYFQGVPPQTQGGHLELPRLLNSPFIDYFAAPYDYDHRLPGDDGRPRSVVDAFALAGKAHLIEDDTRTSLHTVDEFGRAPDKASSVAMSRRSFGTALIHRTALWWCDFGATGGGGWYDDPALIGDLAKLMRLAERRLETPSRPVAQVALVADPGSCYYLGDGEAMKLHLALVERVTGMLHRTGAPFDFLTVGQLATANLSRYRVLVFLNVLGPDTATRRSIQSAVTGRSAVWLWAPGITDGQGFGPELVRGLSGFQTELRGNGVAATEAEAVNGAPLTSGLPRRTLVELDPKTSTPVSVASDPKAWFNPRDAATMHNYPAFEVTPAPNGIEWRVSTTDGWTDLHLQAFVPACDGLGLTVSATGLVVGAGLRVVVKGADGAEFMSEVQPVTAEPAARLVPFAGLRLADWYHGPAKSLRFPLAGLKLVLYGRLGEPAGSLRVSDLAGLRATAGRRETRIYEGAGRSQTCLTVPDQPGVTPLARSAAGDTLVAARGPAGQRQVFSALASLPLPLLTALLDEAGVHRFVTQPGVLVQADSGLLMLHTKEGGPCRVKLPGRERLTDALTGQVVGEGTDMELTLPAPSTTLLERLRVER